jgi:hypothetical protein
VAKEAAIIVSMAEFLGSAGGMCSGRVFENYEKS